MLSNLVLLSCVGISLHGVLANALQRSIGNPTDPKIQNVVHECLNTDPLSGFGYHRCPHLLRCALDNLPSDITAGMQSGANIASLLPTILALIGASPLELVRLAFTSPLRAVATCVFAIGLPSAGLFRQLQTHLPHLATDNPDQPEKREWRIPVVRTRVAGRIRTLRTIAIDLVILALAGVMLWRNVVIGLQSMVTWRYHVQSRSTGPSKNAVGFVVTSISPSNAKAERRNPWPRTQVTGTTNRSDSSRVWPSSGHGHHRADAFQKFMGLVRSSY
ncbi:hypothetical protein M409DRAFT_56501 [Zasmidium cellare ATCC 36951]|uniref:Solute carrier family 40 protein n=1 Tax=Zasmidium cellare ATCC 36951 TaxID=1080233 RepID=A0A6A6CEM7_ZASCE|nr:uncharacterized protein M409DRAFT_56501 [Zasmidium cellare ATCC 36951]KAF2164690.1 hypothetical protein M409DRAFT_56501 [Zasmidium cellare ATCC 36951]